MEILKQIFMGLNVLSGSILNLNLFIVMICRKKLRSLMNYGLISLSFCDFLYASSGIPLVLFVSDQLTEYKSCLILAQIFFFQVSVSFLIFTYTAFERFLAIVKPMIYQRVWTTKVAIIVLVCLCFACFLFGITPFFGWNREDEFTSKNLSCGFVFLPRGSYAYVWCFGIILPSVGISVYFYIFILIIINQQRRKISTDINDNIEVKAKSVMPIIFLLIFNVVLFIQSLVFLYVVNVPDSDKLKYLTSSLGQVLDIASLFALLNPTINPLIHGYSRKTVRKEMIAFYKTIVTKLTSRNF